MVQVCWLDVKDGIRAIARCRALSLSTRVKGESVHEHGIPYTFSTCTLFNSEQILRYVISLVTLT